MNKILLSEDKGSDHIATFDLRYKWQRDSGSTEETCSE